MPRLSRPRTTEGLAPDEHGDPHCLGAAETGRLLAGARWRRMIVLGEGGAQRRVERVEGYGGGLWYDRVTDALRGREPELACLNLLGGKRRRSAAVRSDQLADALVFGGDLAVVQLSGQDLLHPSFDPGVHRTELVRVISPLRERGLDVVLVEPFSLARSPEARGRDAEEVGALQRAQAERTRTVAQFHGALHVSLAGLPAPAVAGVWERNGPTPNARGHARLASAVVRALASGLHSSARRRPAPVEGGADPAGATAGR